MDSKKFLIVIFLSCLAISYAEPTFKPIPIQAYEEIKPKVYSVNVKIANVSYTSKSPINYSPPKVIKKSTPPKIKPLNFENSVFITDKYLIKDINYLYNMGYLPFKVISYTPYKNGYKVTYEWDTENVPSKLVKLSITSKYSILYKSAILRFIKDYNVKFNPDNTALASIILQQAYKTGFKAKKPFVWVYVDQHIPQRVYVWENGKYIFESPANTGVMGTTNTGTYMVYLRFRKTEMKGTFPGSNKTYDDPDVPWVNYFYRGEALHGFPRRRYGYPQSAGCVELPIPKARELYKILYKYAVVTLSNYDKRYIATHPYVNVKKTKTFKPLNPVKFTFESW
ncbi:MAG: L,D-transpeptidase [Hydrogenobaculum sp.]